MADQQPETGKQGQGPGAEIAIAATPGDEARPDAARVPPELQKLGTFSVAMSSQTAGPLPDPESLEKYRILDPKVYEQILKMAKESFQLRIDERKAEGDHRRKMEEKRQDADIADETAKWECEKRGQWLGFCLIALALASACIISAISGAWGVAAFLGGLSGIGGVALAVRSIQRWPAKSKAKDIAEKQKE